MSTLDVEIGDLFQKLQDKLEEREAAATPQIPRSPTNPGMGGEYINELTPPAGTMFFKRFDFEIYLHEEYLIKYYASQRNPHDI